MTQLSLKSHHGEIPMTGKEALPIFYAIFWGVQLSTQSRFSPFGIAGFSIREPYAPIKNLLRYVLSILFLNVLPAILFLLLYNFIIPDKNNGSSIICACIASLPVFAFGYCLTAILNCKKLRNRLYSCTEILNKQNNGAFGGPFEDNPKHFLCFAGLYSWYIVFAEIMAYFIC